MANPRKFSEKIALHNQRQAEDTAKFQQIMREVSVVTAKVLPSGQERTASKHTLRINQTLGSFQGGSLPNVSKGTTHTKDTNVKDQQDTPNLNIPTDTPTTSYRESRNRSVGVGPMRSRPIERRIDTSPYSGNYLSPPHEPNWRRANSDSALHQSAMQGMSGDRSGDGSSGGSRWMLHSMGGGDQNDGRPRSSCDVPRVPGINIYPSAQEPGTVQIPIGNNTGSLPDLTSVHFPSPLHTPIDQEADHSSSPYSSSPVSASPATLSPTSLPTAIRSSQTQFQFSNSPRQISQHQHQNHLSVPLNSRYLHLNKGVTLENSIPSLVDGVDYAQASIGLTGMPNMYQQTCPTSSPSPTLQQPPVSGPAYRSPLNRPSPQSSPGLSGRHSAPSSPAAQSPLPEYYLNQTQASLLQQHFEQFSMDWAQLVQSLMESGCTWSTQVQTDPQAVTSVNYIDQTSSVQLSQSHPQSLTDVTIITGPDLTPDGNYYAGSPSPLMYQTAPTSLHTTPNTPTSIPDITLTDFSSTADELSRQEYITKDLNVMTGLDSELYLSDESLREGLAPLDFDGMQMLSDPDGNLISDSVEDHFRLDRL